MNYRKVFLLFVCLSLAACNMPQAESKLPQAWIDAPLDRDVLPLAPYEIVFHASAPGAPAAVELSINGQLVPSPASQPDGADASLAVVRYPWDPQAPGRYTLSTRARDAKGNWSEVHTHVVTIGETMITPTSTETSTPTPATTVSPTATPTATSTPTSNVSAGFSNKSISSNVVSRGHCGTSQVTLQIDAQHPAGIKVVVIFFRLEDFQSGKLSPWNDGVAMNISQGHYTRTLSGDLFGKLADFQQARIHYQFILQPLSGEYVRSEVYSDLSLTACGGGGITPLPSTIPGDINPFPTEP